MYAYIAVTGLGLLAVALGLVVWLFSLILGVASAP